MPKTFIDFADDYIESIEDSVWKLDMRLMELAARKIKECQGTVWLIGNGGSASLASHMATDLQLAGVRAISLTDVAAVTTYANDFGCNTCFEKQLERLAKPGDILIAISGSGNSTNIIIPCEWARESGAFVIGVSGFEGGELKSVCDLHLHAPASHMGRAQDLEQVMLHIICYWLMEGRK